MRIGGGEADLEHVVGAEPRVQGDAAAARTMGVDQRRYHDVELRLLQRLHDKSMLPGTIAIRLPMLDRAAATDAEMRAEGRNPFGTRYIDCDEPPPVGMAVHVLDLDRLATQRIGHVDHLTGCERHTVAAMADVIDEEPFNHVAR